MSFMHNKSVFLTKGALNPASSFAELDVPPHPVNGGKHQAQRYNFAMGSQFMIFDPDRRRVANCAVLSRNSYGLGGEKFLVQNTDTNETTFLSDWQISILEREWRLVPINSAAKREIAPTERPKVRSYLSIPRERRAEAIKRWWYARKLVLAREGGKVRLTKKLILEVAANHAREKGHEKTPCYNSLRIWLKKYEANPFNRILALVSEHSSGNPIRKFDPRIEDILDDCVQWAWELPAGTALNVESQFKLELAKRENRQLLKEIELPDGTLNVPSFRTIERRFAAPDNYSKDLWRYGIEAARRKHTFYTHRDLPDHSLSVVEVDYTTADICVYDAENMCLFGRPSVLFFVSKKSGCILGFAVHFDNQSYEAFLYGLRMALYPKDMSRFPGAEWAQYGDFMAIPSDNATFLRGEDIKRASEEIGFEIIETLPGEPTGKGLVERMFRTLNTQVFHLLPGTTMSNVERRRLFDDAKGLGLPMISLQQLEDFITLWIVEYHRTPRRGIGLTPRLKAIPQDVWDADLKNMPPRDPIDPEIFVSLGGHRRKVTIQNDGVTYKHLTWYSEDLLEITAHPNHKPGTEYELTVDPSDLSNAFITNPYRRDRVIRLRPNGRCAKYADGLRLFVHRKIIEHHNKVFKRKPITIESLELARRTLPDELSKLLDKKKLQRTAQALAKFQSQVTRKLKRSAIVNVVESEAASADHLDFAAPFSPGPARTKSPNRPGRGRDGTPAALVSQTADGEIVERDPLEDAVAEHKRRGTPRTEPSGPVSVAVAPVEAPLITEADRRAALRERLAKKGFDE
ncbi:hypothetical protein [Shinella kummerowiae]|uniref:hypothetical protein n=1 Tax=Shinella kummerowiae TaxID=417745 RepID=UPI001FE62FD3|nr:hypothetical protein [Shinella kummerowiae]